MGYSGQVGLTCKKKKKNLFESGQKILTCIAMSNYICTDRGNPDHIEPKTQA